MSAQNHWAHRASRPLFRREARKSENAKSDGTNRRGAHGQSVCRPFSSPLSCFRSFALPCEKGVPHQPSPGGLHEGFPLENVVFYPEWLKVRFIDGGIRTATRSD